MCYMELNFSVGHCDQRRTGFVDSYNNGIIGSCSRRMPRRTAEFVMTNESSRSLTDGAFIRGE